MSELSLRDLTVMRRLPLRAQVGRPHLVEIEVFNHKKRVPSYAIEVEDLRAGQPADKRCFFLKISPNSAQVAAYRRTPAQARARSARRLPHRHALPVRPLREVARGRRPRASSSSIPRSIRCASRPDDGGTARRRRRRHRARRTATSTSACGPCATATTRATSTGARARVVGPARHARARARDAARRRAPARRRPAAPTPSDELGRRSSSGASATSPRAPSPTSSAATASSSRRPAASACAPTAASAPIRSSASSRCSRRSTPRRARAAAPPTPPAPRAADTPLAARRRRGATSPRHGADRRRA